MSTETGLIQKKVIFFYNPISGNGLFGSRLDEVVKCFQARGRVCIPRRRGKQFRRGDAECRRDA